ncbi:TonB-dependent receptor plug domain-containing protein [Mesorhizobium sp. BHbsci]
MTARRNLLIAAMSLPVLLGSGHAVAQEATTTLDPINVQERVESAFGTVDGYVATQGSTATKTDTPLIETPQSISVITKDQMEAQAVDSLTSALRYTPGASGNLYGTDNRGHGLQMRGISNSRASSTRTGCSSRRAISRCSRRSIPTAPHLARMLGFQRALPQLFASAMLGGMMLVSADWTGRMLISHGRFRRVCWLLWSEGLISWC